MEKIVVVTGASGGIGRAIVEGLVEKEYRVLAIYNKSEDKMEEIKEQLENIGKYIDIYKCDLTKRECVNSLIEEILKKYKKIDVLINNAGVSQIKEFTQITQEDWNYIIENNLNSVFYMTQEVCKSMIYNKEGCIINISSIWGITGASCEVHYSVSKAGIDAMTKSLAKELGPSNIRVNSIAPGIIETKMNENFSEAEIDDIKENIALEKIGKGKDVERCIEWLIEDEYTTGQIISINGGWLI